jgi:hypothetical protein
MSTAKKAIGLFSVKARENGGDEVSIPTKNLVLVVKPDQLRVGGFNIDSPPAVWGAQLDIKGEIKPGLYPFTKPDAKGLIVIGFYNPKVHDNSWNGKVEGGEINLLEVDMAKKFARGSFKFTAVDERNPEKTAEVSGDFSLTE